MSKHIALDGSVYSSEKLANRISMFIIRDSGKKIKEIFEYESD